MASDVVKLGTVSCSQQLSVILAEPIRPAHLHEGSPDWRSARVGGPASEGVQQRANGSLVLPQVQPAPAKPPPDVSVARRNLHNFANPRQGMLLPTMSGSGAQEAATQTVS